MKIYILPIPKQLQPTQQSFIYPNHNRDYGVEQDFLIWLLKHPELLTNQLESADWHYLPVFWTRWHINHNFAANSEGLDELQNYVNPFISNDEKTFTICMYDDGPLIDLKGCLKFLCSKNSKLAFNVGINIPLICEPHPLPLIRLKKKYLASFDGNIDTHPIRASIKDQIIRHDVRISHGGEPRNYIERLIFGAPYIENMIRSYAAICPRGYGGTSFRFYEAMQLGIPPILIADYDSRPFKKYINWNEFSFYVSNAIELNQLLNNLKKNELRKMGPIAKKKFENEIKYQKWCKYVISELMSKL